MQYKHLGIHSVVAVLLCCEPVSYRVCSVQMQSTWLLCKDVNAGPSCVRTSMGALTQVLHLLSTLALSSRLIGFRGLGVLGLWC